MINENNEYFKIRIIIKHPFIKKSINYRKMECDPDFSCNNKSNKITPAGRIFKGINIGTTWSKSYSFPGVKSFLQFSKLTIENLKVDSGFISYICNDGGYAQILVDIIGSTNIGDVISSKDIMRIGESGFSFGIEVFP